MSSAARMERNTISPYSTQLPRAVSSGPLAKYMTFRSSSDKDRTWPACPPPHWRKQPRRNPTARWHHTTQSRWKPYPGQSPQTGFPVFVMRMPSTICPSAVRPPLGSSPADIPCDRHPGFDPPRAGDGGDSSALPGNGDGDLLTMELPGISGPAVCLLNPQKRPIETTPGEAGSTASARKHHCESGQHDQHSLLKPRAPSFHTVSSPQAANPHKIITRVRRLSALPPGSSLHPLSHAKSKMPAPGKLLR